MAAMARDLANWLDYIERQHPKSIAMGLDRVREVATRLQLEKPAKQVIVVAGTNGKGSTVAFIESIAREAGWKVGAYTSPHLLRYNERVRIEGVEADDAALVEAFEAVETARGDTPLTYFEYGTLAALWLFQRANLDLAILEVGLGGRLDAVNIVDADVAVITTIDIDHVEWLGPDRESIGAEKAGIARAWKPLVLGEVDSPSSVLRHAYAIGANAIRFGSDFFADSIDATHWRWRDAGNELALPNPPLPAPAQFHNAATAIAALRALPQSPVDAAFAPGIANTQLPGRLQRFERGGVNLYIDVGHNPQAARELAAWLAAQSHGGRDFIVYAALADKDAAQVVAAFDAQPLQWLLAGSREAGARGQGVDALAAKLAGTAAAQGERHADAIQALAAALAQAEAGDRVLVFGSFHAAATALDWLHSGQ
ncbi:MAG: bifunctional tetrahydrofolate synthase/dihydrofolate synthase [Pseudoxanthomonas sp.]